MNLAQQSEPQVMYKTPKTQGNSYNHLHGIHEKLTINHQLEKHKHAKHQLDATSHRLPEISPPPRTHISLKRFDFHN